MRRFAPPVPRWSSFVCLLMLLTWVSTPSAQQTPRPIVDPNVNMVRGITVPNGDPYLQRQNEPSIAVSTRNPCHLVAGANDYRAVDIPFDNTPPPNEESNLRLAGDAWLGLFKSFDCGQKWSSTLLPGFPQDNSTLGLPLKGFDAGADPTVRAGSNGLFYYSGMVFDRGLQGDSKIFVARLIDNNNKERGDPIEFIDVGTIDVGSKGQFLDKPWLAVDIPRSSFGPGSTLGPSSAMCDVAGQRIPAGNVYMAWARFTGDSHDHSKLMFAKSADCGKTWKTFPVSNNQTISQGANLAIAPHDGTIYLTWREFASEGSPVHMWIAVSSDGGETFSKPTLVAQNLQTFDQARTTTKFRTNSLPAITADHQNRVYVAWSETGYGWTIDANGLSVPTADARIVMAVSIDRGKTFFVRYPIDPATTRGHQVMPQLAFAAGKIQAIYYDAREDVSGIFNEFIDDKDVKPGSLRHTVDVRGVQADPAAQPVFVAGGLSSLEISKYRQWSVEVKDANGNVQRTSTEIGANPPNLPMYAAGTTPFMGDYVDVSALSAFPIQTTGGQVWQPNIGPINLIGAGASSIMANGFPTLPIFHAAWTDNRDVQVVSQVCSVPPAESARGDRNANVYTARLTPGLFVGSPGNTKPLGYRIDPESGKPTTELMQRGFVVFAQNTTDVLKFYEFHITNQPLGGKATFRQFEKPEQTQLTKVVVSIPKQSTVARTVYATSTDVNAQILVNVQEVTPVEKPGTALGQPDPTLKKQYDWLPAINGLRASILLNPDRTNPAILDPDIDGDIPEIATTEVHNPSMFDAQFFKHRAGTSSRQLDVKNPDPESPDPESPDPESPDPESPDPESDPENPDPESPDPESPDPESPDPESPDPESAALLNTAISEEEVQNSTITDINWRVHNSGNTTSAYRFRPVLQETGANTKYQLIVTRRYLTLTMDTVLDKATNTLVCKPVYKSQNHVVVNIVNFDPKAPDPESPDPESPDPESPDPESPDPESPDPESPDPESANFFLAPEETATVTLRVFTPVSDEPPTSEDEGVAARTSAQAANTGETIVSEVVRGAADLTLHDELYLVAPAVVRPGHTANVTWTLTNRGSADAIATSGSIKTRVYLSTNNNILDQADQLIATVQKPTPFAFCPVGSTTPECATTTTTPVPMPQTSGLYYVIIETDGNAEIFEAELEGDDGNNLLVIPVNVAAYELKFVSQPSATTQDYAIDPPVTVAILHPDNGVVSAADVPGVTLTLQNNPAAGTLAGNTTQPNVGGVATFNDLRINQVGTGYTLAANAPFSSFAISAPFNIEADVPPDAADDAYTVSEDQVLTVTTPGLLTNDTDPPTKGIKPSGYALHAVKQSDPANGALGLSQDGSFTYTPQADFTGTNTFTYQARDGRPGNSDTATVSITVTAVNDAPSFTKGADQTVTEDAGLQTVPNWATAISAGPANESGQVVDFIVTNGNAALFSTQPSISPNGTLTYMTAANRDGVAIVTVQLHDNGCANNACVGNAGDDTSEPQTFTITVTGANDAPAAQNDTYTTREDTTLNVDGSSGVERLLFNDTDADGNSLTAQYLTTTSNGALATQPNGSFTYIPNPNFFGVDSFTYRPFDGTTAGNTVTVTINVLPVNDAPSFTKGENQLVPMNATTQVFAWAEQLSAGPANEASQALDFIVTNDNATLFATQPSISPSGTLTFTPRNNVEGIANVTVRLHDNGGTAIGGVDTSAPQTFVITITAAVQNYVVTNTNDSGKGSLRLALENANANDSHDVISFNISAGTGVRTITPLTPLPPIVFRVTINAATQPGYSGTPLIELNGSSTGAAANGFTVQASNVTIRGFAINRFQSAGIRINGSNNVVAGNYIGTNAAGTAALPNGLDGVQLFGAAPNVVGGSIASERNLISGNARHGVFFSNSVDGNAVRGNYIGTNAAGTAAIGNGQAGVWVEQSGKVTIGGTLAGEGNTISGNSANGIHFYICSPTVACTGATVQGNRIGTNAAGTAAIPNKRNGIEVTNSPNHTIRGNVISGNGTATDNLSGDGISIIVPTPTDDPLAEERYGNHTIAGNLIGTNAAGSAAIPNTRFGISLQGSTKARIGGTTAADRNVISFNGNTGVFVGWGTTFNNTLQGNYIGVNAAGTQVAANQGSGVYVSNGSTGNVIGGSAPGAGNVIGGNLHNGVSIVDTSSNNVVEGNFIGLSADGAVALANQLNGVSVDGANNVTRANQIANNTNSGVIVNTNGTQNRITQNSIYNNGLLGIDLVPVGVTANDAGDADTGANHLQNFPVISAAHNNNSVTTVIGTLNSTPGSAFTIELFSNVAADASGNGEGRTYLTSVPVTTDPTGNAAFTAGLAVGAGQFVTATATDASGNTSEFSNARVVLVNTAPTTNPDSATTAEDSSVAIAVLANDTDPDIDALSVGSIVQPANGVATAEANGTITYAPNANFFGTDSFTYRAIDSRGGLSQPATVNVTVTAVNDAPSFVNGPNQSVPQNAGLQTVANWATSISAGPFESTQTVDFIVTNDNNALFEVQPAVSPTGTLTFDPANGVAGSAIVSVHLHDNGGTTPGVDTSAIQTFTITVVSTTTADYIVTNTNDSGNGSLRQALLNSNATPFSDVIKFNIAGGGGEKVILPVTPLPVITGPVSITGTTQPGYDGKPMIRLHGGNGIANGLETATDVGGLTVKGLSITGFTNAGLYLLQADTGTSGHVIEENLIGIDRNDTAGIGNGTGIVLRTDHSTITRNVLSGNTANGIRVENDADNVTISTNKIGTTIDGLAARPNGTGVLAFGSLNNLLIENNVISANTGWGIDFQDLATAHIVSPRIRGNTIGLLAGGSIAAGNGSGGVKINNAGGTLVGEVDHPPNVISGNTGPGIHLMGSPTPMPIVQHNYIGTDNTGTLALGNALGILVSGNSHALIGGTSAAARNVISGNTGFGIEVNGSPTTAATIIQGNFIGLAADGNAALGNGAAGIKTTNGAVMVGGTTPGARNVIAANLNGLSFSNSGTEFNSFVYGNYFGTDVTGTLVRGGGIGVSVGSAPGTRVGGDQPGQGNLFAGSATGVSIFAGSHQRIDNLYNSVIQGNTFGLSATGGALPLGTAIAIGNSFNLVGGSTPAARNIIANSTNAGVVVTVGEQNSILGNSIFDNGGLGIDLNNDGVTLNDSGDTNLGANNRQNFPVITGALTTGESTLLTGSLNSLANQTYRLEFFTNAVADPTGHGEGQQLFSRLDVTTDAAGNATFSDASGAIPPGTVVTATATDSAGNTSEFSEARVVVANTAPTATADSGYTISGQQATFSPAANDIDPDVASPQIRATYQPMGAAPVLTFPGDVAIVSSTGLGYFSGGNLSAATDGKIGILNLANNTISGAIQMRGGVNTTLVRVSQSTRIAYMRTGNFLQAIDGRPESPTFNQSILNVFFGPIQSMALNETTKRLYATALSTGVGLVANGRVVVIDIDPTSPSFHQILDQITVPSLSGTASAIAVNPATNKVYVGVGGQQPGVWVIEGTTHAITQVSTGGLFIGNPQAIAVNDAENLVYAIQGSNLHAIDGETSALITTVPLPANAGGGNLDTRIAIHRANGKVFVRLAEFPNPSHLVVVDGKKTNATFNQIVATLTLGRENNQTIVAIDEAANRLITTSTIDHESHILDATSHDLLATIKSTQNAVRASIDLQTHRAYVTGAIGHLQVIDLPTAQLVSTVQVGVELFGLAVDPSTHSAYLAQTGATTAVVRVSDTGFGGSVPLPHVDGRATYVARNSVTNKIYVLNAGATAAGGADAVPGFVHVIDGANNTVTASVPVGGFPFGLAVDEVNNKIYAGNSLNAAVAAGITVINGVDNSTAQADLSAIPLLQGATGLSVARDLAPNTATGKMYFRIVNGSSTQLGVLNGLIGSPLTLTTTTNVNIIRVNPALNRVYVGATQPNTTVNQIHVLNGATDQLITSLNVGFPSNFITNQSYLAVNTNNGRVYVTDFLNNYVTGIDGVTNNVFATIPVGRGPGPVAVNMAANRIYVGNAIERSLTIIDGATNRVVRTLALPLAPVQIAVDDTLSPARLYIQSTANEAKLVVVDDPGTSAPSITAITQPANGTAVLNADGTVTYTPNAGFSGTDSYTYTTNDGNGGVTTATAYVTVAPALSITTATAANGMINAPYSQTFTTTGGTGAVSWLLFGTLPGGLTITPAGTLSGTPAQAGTFNITMQARDSGTPPQIAQASYTILIGPPTIAPALLNNGTVNVPYSQQLFLGAGVGNVTWFLDTGGHPALAWLSLSSAGVLSGTHTTYGSTPSFTVTAVDSAGQKAQRTYTIFFNAPLDLTAIREGVVLETPPSLPIVGGNGSRTAAVVGGALPPGVTLNSSGSFSGTILNDGTYDFTVELRDCSPANTCGAATTQQVVTRAVSMRVSAREQQGNSQTNPPVLPIAFGGPGGARLAQVITVGAHGVMTAVGMPGNALSCPTQTPLTFEIQRLTLDGTPDGNSIASGTATTTFNQITLANKVPVSIGTRLAIVVSSPLACSMNSAPAFDFYQGGHGFIDHGAGWKSLFEDVGRYDLTSVRTLIQPAADNIVYLNRGRGGSTATLLANGKVLIVGNNTAAELYDPATNSSTLTANAMVGSRTNHTATLLQNGTVLIVGGFDGLTGQRTAVVELFDPSTGLFTTLPSQLTTARDRHKAVLLNDGRVLISGGQSSTNGNLTSAELYDPATQTFSNAGNMLNGRQQHVAVLLGNNKVLLAGGYVCCTNITAELFDPATNAFAATTGNMVASNRGEATGTLLADGRVLIAGGQSDDVRFEAELYNPAIGTFAATGSLAGKRFIHTATLLPDGSVLIAGGHDQPTNASYIQPLATLERYDPIAGTFSPAGSLQVVRQRHAAVPLASGAVLIVGGFSQSWMTNNTAELYDPSTALSITPTTLPDGTPGVAYPAVVLNASGGTPPHQVSHVAGALPPGMTYAAATRTLAGTPAAGSTGLYALGFEATDAANHKMMQSYALRIGNVITITSPYRLADAALNSQYSVQLTSTGMSPVIWSLAPASSALPNGLTLGSAGAITGTPTQTGFFNFAVRATGADGQQAIKVLAISVVQPLTITTTSLNNVDLFGGGPGCVNASNGTGTRFWDLAFGGLPQGLAINSGNGCINGSALITGTFTFTVRVTDQSTPPQVATREFTINSWAMDQNTSSSATEPQLTFGGTIWIGERIFTGVTGTLRAVRIIGASCPAGTIVTAQIQGMRPDGAPNGTVLASGQATAPLGTIVLSSGIFFAADAQFTLVFSSDQNCTIRPVNFDSYPGTGYVATNINNWQTQLSVDGRHDLPFVTLVEPLSQSGLLPMSTWRGDHAETLLPNGKVLFTGGNGTNQADLYDPAANSIAPVFINGTVVISTMTTPRSGHTATLLGNGNVLIAGGYDNLGAVLSSAEIYNPGAGTFTAIASMSTARHSHTATRLPDGNILITGGTSSIFQTLQSAEIFQPATNTFVTIGNMLSARNQHTATLLNDGRVLLAGGFGPGSGPAAELYNHGSMSFVPTDGSMVIRRGRHTATLLADGTVLIAGGTGNNSAQSSAELFDPAAGALLNGTFTAILGMQTERDDHSAVRLGDGSVLVAGGLRDTTCCNMPHEPQATMERYVPGTGWVNAGSMRVSRYRHTATVLDDGRVLMAGTWGWTHSGARMAEMYDPASALYFVGSTSLQGMVGQPFSHELIPGGGTAPRTVGQVSGALPPGLGFFDSPLRIAGTPTAPGTFTATFRITDATQQMMFATFTIRIDPVIIVSGTLPNAYTGVGYSSSLTGSGVGGIVKWELIGGSLPNGLSLNQATGAITGTTTATCCTYFFTVRATDSIGQTGTKALSINVQQPLNITTTTLSAGTAGSTYFGCVNANGGNGLRTWSLTGTLPIGLAIAPDTGCFENEYPAHVIRQGGEFAFTVNVHDASVPAQQDSQHFIVRFTAADQQPGGSNSAAVAITTGRRIAQVYTSSSPFPIAGVQVWGYLTCVANSNVSFELRRVIGQPARPDETGAPLAVGTLSTNASGFFTTNTAAFASPVAMPQGSQFAIVAAVNGVCQGESWPTTDFYSRGQGWIDDGSGWNPATTVVGRFDIPFTTVVLPATDLRFHAGWLGGQPAVTLDNGKVFLLGGDGLAELYDPSTNTLTTVPGNTDAMRHLPTATKLTNGNVLIVGGSFWDGTQNVAVASTMIFNPANGGSFSTGPTLPVGRYSHEATRLSDGRVLITGGWTLDPAGNNVTLASAVLFDATGGSFTTLNMTGARVNHTATLIDDGRVVIIGGWTGTPFPPTAAEIYDPNVGANGEFSSLVVNFPTWPSQHSATLLTTGPNAGKIVVLGGAGNDYPNLNPVGGFLDVNTQSYSAGPTMNVARLDHTAAAMPDGRIAIVGGISDWLRWGATTVVEIYNPATNVMTVAGDTITDRQNTAVSVTGPILEPKLAISGGWGSSQLASRAIELVDLSTNVLRITTASLPNGTTTGAYLTAPLAASGGTPGYMFALAWGSLPPGLTLNMNGDITGTPTAGGVYEFAVEVIDGASAVAYRTLSIAVDRLTILSNSMLPAGVAGAFYSHQLQATGSGTITWSLEPYATLPGSITLSPSGLLSGTGPAVDTFAGFTLRVTDSSNQVTVRNFTIHFSTVGQFAAMNPMTMPRRSHVSAELNTGRVLLAGSEAFGVVSSEVYDPQTGGTHPTGSLNQARCYGCASVTLDDGTVLAAGGWNGGPVLSSAETYDPATGMWTLTSGDMTTGRLGPNAVKLNSGFVLILGGHNGSTPHNSAELYDPNTRSFTPSNPMNVPRTGAAAVKLADGRVLVAGGQTPLGLTNSAEIYDPATGAFTMVPGIMLTPRQPRDATLLPDGRVLFAGGGATATESAEVFDPATGQFTAVGAMATARDGHSMVLMPYGKVLVFGGVNEFGNVLSWAELFDPATNQFSNVLSLMVPRAWANRTLLANGEVLVTGGSDSGGQFMATVEKYRPQ